MNFAPVSLRLTLVAMLTSMLAVSTFIGTALAQSSQSVACVRTSPTTCVATVPLSVDMHVDITFLLPPNKGYSFATFTGTGQAVWTSLNGGYWSGTGTSLTALLMTPSNEPPGAASTVIVTLAESTTTTVPRHFTLPGAVAVAFSASSYALSAGAKSQLTALSRKLHTGARVTYTGYAHSNPLLAKDRALTVANYLHVKVKVFTRIVTVTTKPLNRVLVVTTAQ